MSAIDDKYNSLGGPSGFLGNPRGPETTTADGGAFRFYDGGAIYWTKATGAHEVHGLILQKWGRLGWERSPLGYPTTDETASEIADGKYNLFQHGRILWRRGAPEAFEVHGEIDSHYARFRFEGGLLGFPVTDESPTSDGRYNHFEKGSIYWKQSIGAHEVHGLIRDYWASVGWERSSFGYPISDESSLPLLSPGGDRFSDFENGVIYWKFGAPAAEPWASVADIAPKDVVNQLDKVVLPLITNTDPEQRIYKIISIFPGVENPFLMGVTDYSVRNGEVRNRLHQLRYSLGIHVSGAPDPSVILDLSIELNWSGVGPWSVVGRLWGFHVDVTVPFPTDIVQGPGQIVDQFKAGLDPQIGQPHFGPDLPKGFVPLSVKTMANGDVRPFLLPWG